MKIPTLLIFVGMLLTSASPLAAQTTPSPSPAPTVAPTTVPVPSAPAAVPGAPTGGTVTLKAPNQSGPTAKALLAQQGSDVLITIQGQPDQSTAALLAGSCANGPKANVTGPAQPLKPLVDGSSQTVVPNTTVAQLSSTPHAIVVQGGKEPLLCGNVGTLTAQPPPP